MPRTVLIALAILFISVPGFGQDRPAALVAGSAERPRQQAMAMASLPVVSRHLVALEPVAGDLQSRKAQEEPSPALQVGEGFRTHGGGQVRLTELRWRTDGGIRRATVAMESAHGSHFRLAIDRLDLPSDANLKLLDPLGENVLHILDPNEIDEQLTAGDGPYWTPTVAGRGLLLMVELPVSATVGPMHGFRLPMVSALDSFESALDQALRFTGSMCVRHSAQCFVEDGGSDLARQATFAIFITRSNGGTSLCTAVFINSNAQRPYFLTNRHCIAVQSEAASVEAVFGYESDTCTIENANSNVFGTRVFGANLLISGPGNPSFAGPGDYAFLRLRAFPAMPVALAGYRTQVNSNALALNYNHALVYPKLGMRARVRAILPDGDIRFDLVEGYEYAGSSGSGFFQGQGELIGLLAYGPNASDCSAGPIGGPGFASIFPRIRDLLEQDPPPTFSYTAMVEFHNNVLDSYFYAIEGSAEAAAVAAGHAGPGWGGTGQRFEVLSDAERSPHSICRFRGAASGRHVYLPLGFLCQARRSDPSWVYDGIVLMAEPVYSESGQQCPGNAPLYRLFNGDPGAPNYRYTPYQSVVDGTVAAGWQFAGAVGCGR